MRIPARAGTVDVLVFLSFALLGSIAVLGTATEAAASDERICFGCYEDYEQLCPDGHEDHKNSSAPFYKDYEQNLHETCVSTDCSDSHSFTCLNFAVALEALDRSGALLERKQWGELARLIAESDAVTYSTERDALQFTGCDDKLVAHIPLAVEDASQLKQEIAALNELDE